MKPFSKMEAVGFKKPVVTRDGRPVTIIGEAEANIEFPVIGLMQGSAQVDMWTSDGAYYTHGIESPRDLFMAGNKKKGYINIYALKSEDEDGGVLNSTTNILPTEEDAKEVAKTFPAVAVAVPVEWEE